MREEVDLAEDVDARTHGLSQEADVLDTWFSSALWPHSTLGWPEQTPELKYYYPTNVLITSRDIITLWVARMVLTGLHNVGEVPFHEVFIHPKILDGYGEGMSKSKGNGVDPLDVIEKFGADSLRFGLAYLTTETQDVRMPVEFECPHCQKLIEQTQEEPRAAADQVQAVRPGVFHAMGREAGGQGPAARRGGQRAVRAGPQLLQQAVERLAVRADEPRRLHAGRGGRRRTGGRRSLDSEPAGDRDAASDRRAGRHIAMPTPPGCCTISPGTSFAASTSRWSRGGCKTRPQRPIAQRVLAHTLDTLLRLLAPDDPVSDRGGLAAAGRGGAASAAWRARAGGREHHDRPLARWPTVRGRTRRSRPGSPGFKRCSGGLREIRSRQNIPPKTAMQFRVRCDAATAELLRPMEPYFESMAGAKATAWGDQTAPPATSANSCVSGAEVFVDLAGLIDIEAEIGRKTKELGRLAGAIAGKERQLANASFVERAPADVIEKERAALAQLHQQHAATEATLKALESTRK